MFKGDECSKMIKTLAKSVREYKKYAIMTPIFIAFEVLMECLIPFVTVKLVSDLEAGCEMNTVLRYGIILFFPTSVSLLP